MLSVHSEQVGVSLSSWVLQLAVGVTQYQSFSVVTCPDEHDGKEHEVAPVFTI